MNSGHEKYFTDAKEVKRGLLEWQMEEHCS
jgi:hypothetical protein